MSYSRITSEYLPAVIFLLIIGWFCFGNEEVLASFLSFGKSYHGFNNFFCAGWAGKCN